MLDLVLRFSKDPSGATVIEYGLIATLVSVGIASAVGTLGTDLQAFFTKISTSLSSVL